MGPPTPQGGGGWVGWVSEGLGMMWGPSRQCGDDVGMTGMMWGPQGQRGDHGDNMWRPRRPRRPQTMGTTWRPSEGYGDDVGMMGTMQG